MTTGSLTFEYLPDDVIGALERSLHGPRRARADMVREIRDGLTDAVEAYQESGLDGREARRRAVVDFGDPREIAAGLQVELTAGYGRRTAARLAVAFPTLVLLWEVVWMVDAVPHRPRPEPVARWLAGFIDVVSLGSAAGCVLGLLLLWSGARRGVRVDSVTRGIGLLALWTLVADVGSSVLMNLLSTEHGRIYGGLPVLAVLTVTACVAVWVVVSAHRCLILGRFARASILRADA
jgi:HAAS domain-containing protein